MFMRNSAVVIASVLLSSTTIADNLPNLGERISDADIAAVDFTVLPNGEGLPEGSGTAVDGAIVYRNHCMACHGEGGEKGINDRLAGGHGSLTSQTPVKTVGSFWPYATTVFDYIRRAMPFQTPGVLSDNELYAVTAYLLYINEVIGENDEIDATTLPAIRMHNRENFVWDYVPDD